MTADNPGLAIANRKGRIHDKPPQCLDASVVLLGVNHMVHEVLDAYDVNQTDINPGMLAIMGMGLMREYM